MGGFQLAAEFTGIIVGRRKEVAVQPGEIAFDSFLVANAFDEIDPRGVSLVRGARTFDAVQGFDFVNPIVDRRSQVALVRSVCPPPIGPSSRTMMRLPRPANSYVQDKPAIPRGRRRHPSRRWPAATAVAAAGRSISTRRQFFHRNFSSRIDSRARRLKSAREMA